MLDDDAYVARLLCMVRESPVTAAEPPGRGMLWRVDRLEVVASDDGWDDLQVTVSRRDGRLRRWRRSGGRLLFDRRWRLDAGYEEPEDFLPLLLRDAIDLGHRGRARQDQPEPSAEDVAASWRSFVQQLKELGPLEEVDDGLVLRAEEIVHVHLDPVSWARYAAPRDAERASWDQTSAEQLATILDLAPHQGERHLVMFRGEPRTSVRAELPPISGHRPEGGRWLAYRPLAD